MNATEQQIKDWKEKYGEVFRISVKDKSAYFHKPSRQTLGYAQMAGRENPIKVMEAMMNGCWIYGDPEIRTNDELFLSVGQKLDKLVEIEEAELEKL